MANRRPVNRVSSKRRPAAQRSSGARTTAADLRETESSRGATGSKRDTGARGTARTGAQRGPSLSKNQPERSKRPAARPGDFWRTWRVAIICGTAAVLLAALAIVGAVRPGVDDGNKAYVDNATTDQVKAAARDALTTIYGYNAKDIDKFRDTARAVMTGKMLEEFDKDKLLDTGIDAIKQTQTDTKATADPIGVTLLTGDRAELLVNLSIAAIKDGKPQPLAAGPIVLHMQKVGGKWLASEIADR
ncbi:hypothetical protein OHB26_14740 [Nocardia sp. NBC_01503]|uniref:hypothetical protein n=1 Tax=Nocardia sp. NBC_01503 TaxID=2975997 RepID=UPI002E7BEC4E|nr:hypothetical protein [Nocardia sp. NBC_01503]WTL35333.1 hypothetical protein OHB26_14740 [Nocardia sp. NBC_01503]